ncbi:unnamed protein product [Moneuplotes crassus]|uniref:Uncharacterized protein n=1 Tax=Euplotes crassus TaxID=5936 RepID=A0AAD1U068_EUPCR|nr:unnamed protein product [Moneuplotes crassus]
MSDTKSGMPKTWFEMESRIRDILTHLITPISSQLGEVFEKCRDLVEAHSKFERKFETYDELMKKASKKCDEITPIRASMVELETRLGQKQFSLTTKTDHLVNEVSRIEERARLIHDDMRALADLNDALRGDVRQCRKMSGAYHDSCISKINQVSTKSNDDYIDIIERFNALKANEAHYKNVTAYQREKVNEISAELEVFKRSFDNLGITVQGLNDTSTPKEEYLSEIKNLQKELRINRERTMVLEKGVESISPLKEFVHGQVPGKVNYMIAEAMDYVLVKRGDRQRIRKYIQYKGKAWPNFEKMQLKKIETEKPLVTSDSEVEDPKKGRDHSINSIRKLGLKNIEKKKDLLAIKKTKYIEKEELKPKQKPKEKETEILVQVEEGKVDLKNDDVSSSSNFSPSSGSPTPRILHSSRKIKLSRAETITSPKKAPQEPIQIPDFPLTLTQIHEDEPESQKEDSKKSADQNEGFSEFCEEKIDTKMNEMKEELVEELLEDIERVMKQERKTLDGRLNKIQNKVDISIEEIQEKAGSIDGIYNIINEETKRRKRDKSDMSLQVNKNRDDLDKILSKQAGYDISIKNLGEITATVLELLHIGNVLDCQDEEDRQAISLWGFNEREQGKKEFDKTINHVRKTNSRERLKLSSVINTKKDYNVVTVDKDCYSCSNSNQVVLKAFKMACLSYYPSSITFENKVVSRRWLHLKRSEIIKNIYSDYTNLQPWKLGNLEYEKYLTVPLTDAEYAIDMNPFMQETNMNKTLEISSHFESLSRPRLATTKKVDRTIEVNLNKEECNKDLESIKFEDNKKLKKIFTSTHLGITQLAKKSYKGFNNLKMQGTRLKTPNETRKRRSIYTGHRLIREKRRNLSRFNNKSPHISNIGSIHHIKVSRNSSENFDHNSEYGEDFRHVENLN